MKLHKQLTVAGESYPLTGEGAQLAQLNLFTPGVAFFTVKAKEALSGIVIFSTGYDGENIKPWFIGFVETSTQVDAKQQRLFCRELSAVLYNRLPLALRNVDIKQTLAAITESTYLEFLVPEGIKGYTSRKAPAFYNIANGYHAMDSLAVIYGYEKPIWEQQDNGQVFVGSWDDSRWPSRPVEVPRTWETDITSANGATVPALPALRPGALYNGKVISEVKFSDVKMKITWANDPWATR